MALHNVDECRTFGCFKIRRNGTGQDALGVSHAPSNQGLGTLFCSAHPGKRSPLLNLAHVQKILVWLDHWGLLMFIEQNQTEHPLLRKNFQASVRVACLMLPKPHISNARA